LVALVASHPQGPRGWLTAVENGAPQTENVYMGVLCLRAQARFAYPHRQALAKPSGFSDAFADCPRSAPHAIDDYFGPPSPGELGSLVLSETDPFPFQGADSEATGVRNLTSHTVSFTAGAVCTTLHTVTRYFRGRVAPGGRDAAGARCPRTTPVAVSGTFFTRRHADAGKIAMSLTQPLSTSSWEMGVFALSSTTVRYLGGTICVGT
jgi:hypothetical protein